MTDDVRSVKPQAAVRGTLRVAGDKSISHRLAMLLALNAGDVTVEGFLRSGDCLHTVQAMAALGASVRWEGETLHVRGTGGALREPSGTIDLGNSGTGMRLMSGLLAGQPFTAELTGDASLCSRPMGRIKAPLERMGAKIELMGEGGCAPVRIHACPLHAIRYELPVASAQVKSCVLLAGLRAEGVVEVVEPRPTRDHTERLLQALGVQLDIEGLTIRMQGGQQVNAKQSLWRVPGDFSSASFWLVAAACRQGSEITVEDVGLNPRRTALLDVLRRMGAEIACATESTGPDWEPRGSVTVRGRTLQGTIVGGDEIPNLIDELPLVAVAGAMAEGRTGVRDAAELRVKESDRIAATAACLRAFGVRVDEQEDGFTVTGSGGRLPQGRAEVNSFGDHRIAMCAAVLGLCAEAPARIHGVRCIDTSYPSFWDDMGRVSLA